MYATYDNVAIRSISAVAPKRVLDNEAFSESVTDRRYRRRIKYTGIKKRHAVFGTNQRTSDLASIAAEKVLEKLQWDKESINALIFVTQSPDMYAPSTAMLIQTKVGLSQSLLAFDVNLGCSGFTSGVQIMAGLLSQTKGRGILVMGDAQEYAPGTEFNSDYILFGDGGAAVAMEYDEHATSIPSFQMTDGARFKALCATFNHGHIMDGNEIVLFSLNEVVNDINAFHEHYGINRDEVDYYALHQAQKIIVDGVANNCKLPKDKVLEAYEMYGNTSSASIPFALCANTEKFDKKMLKIFGCGFGIGLAWSGILFDVPADMIIPLIESDYTYPDLFK